MKHWWGMGLVALIAIGGFLLYSKNEPQAIFGGIPLILEYATTEEERARGLGGRTHVPDGYGMLFVFRESDRYGFWMKDTLVPLDIYWLDDKGQVISMVLDVATTTYPNVFYPTAPARYVLETRAGFGKDHAVATGTQLVLPTWPIVTK